jgi:hypothetical protein
MCEAPDAPRLPPAALRRAAAWLLAALEARCGGAPAPAAAAAAARQFHALLRALVALLAQVRQHSGQGPAHVRWYMLCKACHDRWAALTME